MLAQVTAIDVTLVVALFSSMIMIVIYVSRSVNSMKKEFVNEKKHVEIVKRLDSEDKNLSDCLEREIKRTGERFSDLTKRMVAGFEKLENLIRNGGKD